MIIKNYNNNNNNKNGDDKNDNDVIIKLIKNAKIVKLFATFLVTEELAQNKLFLILIKNQNGIMFPNYIDLIGHKKKKKNRKYIYTKRTNKQIHNYWE